MKDATSILRRTRRASSALTGVLGALVGLAGCGQLATDMRLGKALTDQDLAMAWSTAANRDADAFTEQFKVKVALDGGGEVYTKLTVTNIASADGRAEIIGKAELADGETHRTKAKRDRDEWTFGADRFDTTVGDNTISVRVGLVEVHIAGEDFTLDYTVTSDLQPLRPPGGTFERGGAFYVTTIPVPIGRMTGKLVIQEDSGPREVALSGVAYVEHRASNLAPYRMALRWFKISEVTTEKTVVLSTFQRTEELGQAVQGWLLVADADGIQVWQGDLDVQPKRASPDPETGYAVPNLVFFRDKTTAKKDPTFRGIIKTEALTQRNDDLRRLSRLEKMVVKRLMKPWTFEFDNARYLFKQRIGSSGAERAFRGTLKYTYQQLNEE